MLSHTGFRMPHEMVKSGWSVSKWEADLCPVRTICKSKRIKRMSNKIIDVEISMAEC